MLFKIAVFDAKPHDINSFNKALESKGIVHEIQFSFITENLTSETVDKYTTGYNAVCCFVHDNVDGTVAQVLKQKGISLILARCSGFDMIDLEACKKLGISVARVPAYSPHAVAEFAAALLLCVNRKTHRAYNKVRDGIFTLHGMVGFDIHGKTVGVVGTGKIGRCFVNIALGFGCNVLAYDIRQSEELKSNARVKYVPLDDVFKNADVISFHVPLTKETEHMLNARTVALMKCNAVIINTSRGKVIESDALLQALLNHKLGGAGLDVYENEQQYFFADHSQDPILDPMLQRFQNMPNVVMTSHQAFLTEEALLCIADVTISNAQEYMSGKILDKMTNHVA